MPKPSGKKAKRAKSKLFRTEYLSRVEGEGSLYVRVKNSVVEDVRFEIFEPPRFFEGFLRNRRFDEAPDITARICGICPVAYQMSAVHAIEDAFGTSISPAIRSLRRLLYCGEWIESHVLHIFFLHAPDFLGYDDAIRMAKDHPDLINRALKLKRIGNDIVRILGGREIHPINVRAGGLYRTPTRAELEILIEDLEWGVDASRKTVQWASTLQFPNFENEYEFVSLRHSDEYPMNEGRIVSTGGLDIPPAEYERIFVEEHVSHSNALRSVTKDRKSYCVGPLARFNLNFDRLTPSAQRAAKRAKLTVPCHNPFKSILVRSVETMYACEEAIRLIREYKEPGRPSEEVIPRAAAGYGCTEAPRGMLYHRYHFDDQGMILDAKLVPPTAQNQITIEHDLRKLVQSLLSRPERTILWQCEQAIRNYDPCISCATHFLKLHMESEP